MPNILDPITQRFVDKWLMDITQVFLEATKVNPELELHFNGASAEGLARELLVGILQDTEYYNNFDTLEHDLNSIQVEAKLDEGGAIVTAASVHQDARLTNLITKIRKVYYE